MLLQADAAATKRGSTAARMAFAAELGAAVRELVDGARSEHPLQPIAAKPSNAS